MNAGNVESNASTSRLISPQEICDLCWDDQKKEIPAFTVCAGVPLCQEHADSLHQSRFNEKPQEETGFVLPKESKVESKIHPTPMNGKPKDRSLLQRPKSSIVANRGIATAFDFADFMAALMTDLVDGNIEPQVAESACWAGDRLLRVVEMQHRLGKEMRDGDKVLKLTGNRE